MGEDRSWGTPPDPRSHHLFRGSLILSLRWVSANEGMLFHLDFSAFVNANQIAAPALDLVSLSNAVVLDDAAFPAVQQFTLTDLFIFEYLLPARGAFYD